MARALYNFKLAILPKTKYTCHILQYILDFLDKI